MPKRVPLHDHVSVDTVDLSDFARSVRTANEDERIDVSGFSASGSNEYLPGPREQSLTVEFYGSYGTGEVHATLWPIYKNRESVPVAWRPNMNQPIGVDNPEYRGNAKLYSYGPGGTRGDGDTFEVVFNAADEDGFDFVDVGP